MFRVVRRYGTVLALCGALAAIVWLVAAIPRIPVDVDESATVSDFSDGTWEGASRTFQVTDGLLAPPPAIMLRVAVVPVPFSALHPYAVSCGVVVPRSVTDRAPPLAA